MILRHYALASVSLTVIITGCETGMTADQCADANWNHIGTKDGAQGLTLNKGFERDAECTEFGLSADLEAYSIGREAGLEQYCTPQNGYDLGAKGSTPNDVCDGFGNAEFLAAYAEGKELYGYTSRVKDAERAIQSAENRIVRLDEKLFDHNFNFDTAGGHADDPDRRRKALRRIRELERELRDTERSLFDLEVELRVAEERLKEYLIEKETEAQLNAEGNY